MNIEAIGVTDLPRLFGFVEATFRGFTREFGRYGAMAGPDLELKVGNGLLCYYDLETRQIYVSFPDPSDAVGRIQFLFMRELLGFTDNDELARFMYLLAPRLLAHEIGHSVRHRHGRFGEDLWLEEQIANQFANAVTKRRYTPAERRLFLAFLVRATSRLSENVESKDSALGSYYSPLHALNVMGSLPAGLVDSVQVIGKLFAMDAEDILERMQSIAREGRAILDRRADLIAGFNRQYSSDMVRYLYYQLGWTLVDLQSREHDYLDDLVRRHLRPGEDTLPAPSNARASERELLALHWSCRTTAPRSDAVGRYFFKRYRSMLLAFILQSGGGHRAATPLARPEVRMLIESWSDPDCDVLDYLEQVVPPDARRLFPATLGRLPGPALGAWPDALSDTDGRILRHVMLGVDDPAARRTVECLTTLDALEGFRLLSAEILIELSSSLCRLTCSAGETVIWEGSENADVFILISGRLDVLMTRGGSEQRVGGVRPGEVFGEMSFLTGERRSATVRAAQDSECFVLRAADLRIFIAKEPLILVQMAKVLARRLRKLDESVLGGPEGLSVRGPVPRRSRAAKSRAAGGRR